MKRMLDREQLYLTDVGKSACEAAARANMSHEWRLAFGGSLLTNALGERRGLRKQQCEDWWADQEQ